MIFDKNISLDASERRMISRNANSLESLIKDYFTAHPSYNCTFTEAMRDIPTKFTQDSYKRSLSVLCTENFLVKSEERRMGNHGVKIHVYKRTIRTFEDLVLF